MTTFPVAANTPTRTLAQAGVYTCEQPGLWQPFADNPATIVVAEPAPGAACGDGVLALPSGHCLPDGCDAVPDTWRIETLQGVSPLNLFAIVIPGDKATANFVCVFDGVQQPSKELLATTALFEACPIESPVAPQPQPDDTTDIPVVPPDSRDIVVVPPASSDIPLPPTPPTP